MAAHLHLFRSCISNRRQKLSDGRTDKTSKNERASRADTLWDQSSLLRRVFDLDPIGNTSMTNGTTAMSSLHTPKQNHLLDALPASDYERLASHLELVPMTLGEVLYESGVQLRYVYFPTTSILSLLYVMEDGASAEIAIVGNEGILGISLFMGGETTPSRAVVQSAGHAFRLKADLLKNEFGRFGPTMHLLLRYTQALITQMAQTAVCNRHHSVDQQLCRWLLLSLDRLRTNELSMT